MDLSTSLVDLDSIDVQPKEYNFNPEIRSVEIEHLAHSIVKLQGLLTIPIVKRTGVESYELLSGYLEYYATLKARELDPQLPDRLRVFIVDEESLNIALEQVDAIEKISKVKPSPGDKTQLQLDNIISILQKMQSSIPEKISTDIQQSNSKILEKIDSRIPKPLPALAAFNQILEPEVYRIVINKMAFIGDKKATKIADKLVSVKKKDSAIQFNTFHDVLEALGKGFLSKEKMLEIIDQWD